MSTLKLVVNNSDSDAGSEERAGEFVEHNAPVLASETLMFILGHASHDELLATCQQQLVDWWALGIAGGQSASDYESVYWYLLFLVESAGILNCSATATLTNAPKNALVI